MKWDAVDKTLTAIAVAGALWKYGKIKKLLIVAPTSVCGVWPKELDEYADFPVETALMLSPTKEKRIKVLQELEKIPGNDLKVAIINYESAWRAEIFEALQQFDADMIIADESQRIKTHNATQSVAMHKLGDKARYKLILSGTPVQNKATDIFSQYRFLDPTIFGTNYFSFRNRYAIMGGFNRHEIIGYRNLDELIQKEHSIAYRVTKAEALDLPEQTFEDRLVQLSPKERSIYDKLRRDSYLELENGEVTAPTVLTKLLRLQQLTGGFLQLDDEEKPEYVSSAKLDALMEIVQDCADAGQKLVVFARFTAEIDLIASALEKAGVRFGMIDGRTPTVSKQDRNTGEHIMSRDEIVADFQTNPKTLVFLAQIQTAGLGITLHAASTAVFYSMDFNYAAYQQATARIHRIGQRHPCLYIHLLVPNSIDERVLKAIKEKDDLARSIVDNWREYF